MIKLLKKDIKNKSGFTLVELIVVIAILGVLAMIAVPKMNSFRSDASKGTHNANVRTLESVANMYLAEYGVPASNFSWEPNSNAKPSIIDVFDNSTPNNMWGKYMTEWPKVPEGVKLSDTEITNKDHKYKVTIDKNGLITVEPAQIP